MGREERRRFIQSVRKKGVSAYAADLYWKMKNSGATIELHEGDRVRLNVKAIQRHPDYDKLTESYRRFVEDHEDDVFTVVYDRKYQDKPTVVCLKEDPANHLFWTGNLIKVVA